MDIHVTENLVRMKEHAALTWENFHVYAKVDFQEICVIQVSLWGIETNTQQVYVR